MAPTHFQSVDSQNASFQDPDAGDGDPYVAAVETKATLTLPSGWCCGFARRTAEDATGRRDIETVFVTRGGLRVTFRRESDRRPRPAAVPATPRHSHAPSARSDARPERRGSRLDIVV